MFWQYGISVSTIDQLFDKVDRPTLESLLAEQDLLQEIKAHNDKVVGYFSDDENIKSVLKYVLNGNLTDGPSSSKYPSIATEILTSGISNIDQAFFENSENLKTLWSVIAERINYGYDVLSRVLKIMTHFCTFKSKEIYSFFKDNSINFVDDMIANLDLPLINDLITRMLCSKIDDCSQQFNEAFIKADFNKKLVEMVSIKSSPEKATGACNMIIEIMRLIRAGTDVEEIQPFELAFAEYTLKDETVNLIVQNLLESTSNEQISLCCSILLDCIFNLQRSGNHYGDEFLFPYNLPPRFVKFQKQEFSSFCDNIPLLINLLKNDQINYRSNIEGKQTAIFGRLRINILETIVCLMLHNNENVSRELSKHDIFNMFLDIIEKYPENNFAHCLIELAISSILQGIRWKAASSTLLHVDDFLINKLLSGDYFITRIITLFHEKRAYSGHVNEIIRTLRKCIAESYHQKIISENINSLPTDIKLKYTTMVAELDKLDEIETIDKKFIQSFSSDFENNDDMMMMNRADSSQYFSVEKGLEAIRLSKSRLTFDEIGDSIENEMEMEIETSFGHENFASMNIRVPEATYVNEGFEHVKLVIEENIGEGIISKDIPKIEIQINTDNDVIENSMNQNNQRSSPVNETTKTLLSMQTIEQRARFHSTGDCNGDNADSLCASSTRNATSSPYSAEITLSDGEVNDAFEDEGDSVKHSNDH